MSSPPSPFALVECGPDADEGARTIGSEAKARSRGAGGTQPTTSECQCPPRYSWDINLARGRVRPKFSQMILSITVKGTASTMPTTPQHRAQNARAINTTSGLRSTARAVNRGSISYW